MAYTTSNKYKQFIYDENSEQMIDIIINGTTINRSYIRSFKLNDEIFESDTFSLGSAITSKITIELDNALFEDIKTSFDAMTIIFKLKTDVGIEIVPMGRYIIKEKDDSSSDFTKFVLYDYMDKFDDEFDASEIVPCTRFELLQAICDHFGVGLENESILNGEVIVGVYDNTIKAKTYLSLISERAGGFAKINRNNKLVIKTLSDVDTIELPENKKGEYTTNDLKTITKISYKNATQVFEQGTDDGETIYLTQDSPFSCSQEEVDNIYQALNGFQYQSLELRIWGDPSIDTGDIITIDGIKSFAQKDWTFGNGFYGSYKTMLNESKGIQVSKVSKNTKQKRLESRLNEVEGTVEILSGEIDGQNEKIASIEITQDQITETVSKTQEITQDNQAQLDSLRNDLNNNYLTQEQADAKNHEITDDITLIKNTLEETKTSTEAKLNIIEEQIQDGVSKVTTTSGIFDENGLHIEKTGEEMSSHLDWDGLAVKRDNDEVLTVRSSGVNAENITVRNYFVQEPIRMEKSKAMTDSSQVGLGFFYVGSGN